MDDETAKTLFPKKIHEKRWFWWLKYMLFAVLFPLVVFLFGKIKESEYWPSIVSFGYETIEEKIPFLSRCDEFHGIEGRVVLPEGYEKDVFKIKIMAIKKGSNVGSDEKCQYGLDLNGAKFKQEMDHCTSNQELKLVLVEGSEKYIIVPRPISICESGLDINLI